MDAAIVIHFTFSLTWTSFSIATYVHVLIHTNITWGGVGMEVSLLILVPQLYVAMI